MRLFALIALTFAAPALAAAPATVAVAFDRQTIRPVPAEGTDEREATPFADSEPLSRAIGERYLTYALSTIMNRALPDAELDVFVDTLASRIATFDKQAIAETFRPYLEARDWVSINRGKVVGFDDLR